MSLNPVALWANCVRKGVATPLPELKETVEAIRDDVLNTIVDGNAFTLRLNNAPIPAEAHIFALDAVENGWIELPSDRGLFIVLDLARAVLIRPDPLGRPSCAVELTAKHGDCTASRLVVFTYDRADGSVSIGTAPKKNAQARHTAMDVLAAVAALHDCRSTRGGQEITPDFTKLQTTDFAARLTITL